MRRPRRTTRRAVLVKDLGPVRPVTFTVYGRPATKGSAVPYQDMRTGQIRVKNDNRRAEDWEGAVGFAARAAGARPGIGPVRMELWFRLPRPASHMGTGRNAGLVRANAPRWPTTKPDIDKVIRAVLDGLTGVVWVDDAQVVELGSSKEYAATAAEVGVVVAIEPMGEETQG